MSRAIISSLAGASVLALSCTPSPPATRGVPARSSTIGLSCSAGFSGPGARPVSPTTVANWYIKDGRLVYAVFLRGIPGWYNKRTSWDTRTDSAGRFVQDFDVGGFRYSLALDESSRVLSVLGKTANMREANIILIDRTADSGVIRSSELMEFCWASPPDVAAEVLARSRTTEQFVGAASGT